MSTATSRRVQRALSASWDGYPVIPLYGKQPRVKWKPYQDRLPTDDEIGSWPWERADGQALIIGKALWEHHPGLWVLDNESEHREDAKRWLDTTVAGWRQGKVVESGSGGLHLYCRSAGEIATSTFKWGDVKGRNSYVVMPPSNHPSGGRYRYLSEGDLVPLEPERVPGYKPNREPLRDVLKTAIPRHSRNDTLFRLGSKLRGDGLPLDTIEVILQAVNRAQCVPPVDADEVTAIAQSVSRYAPNPTLTIGSNASKDSSWRPVEYRAGRLV